MKIQSLLIVFVLLVNSNIASAEWEPQKPVDLHQLLGSTVEDRVSGKYELALKKHIWFHRNSLELDSSFYGVRLSFALSYWVQLANEYPPALDALNKELKVAEEKVKSNKCNDSEAFHDFSAINRELNQFQPVVKLFKYLDKQLPERAWESFDIAKPSLIRAKQYELYMKYVDPEKDILKIQNQYAESLKLSEDSELGSSMKKFAEESYINEVTTLVAILSITGNAEQAKMVYAKSLEKMKTDNLKDKLDKAISGEMPEPLF